MPHQDPQAPTPTRSRLDQLVELPEFYQACALDRRSFGISFLAATTGLGIRLHEMPTVGKRDWGYERWWLREEWWLVLQAMLLVGLACARSVFHKLSLHFSR